MEDPSESKAVSTKNILTSLNRQAGSVQPHSLLNAAIRAQEYDYEAIKRLCEGGVQVNPEHEILSQEEDLPLILATFRDVRLVELLLSFKAQPNALGFIKLTSLYYAVRLGKLDVLKRLMESGADPGIGDSKGNTALHRIARIKNEEFERGVTAGGDPAYATYDCYEKIIRFLLESDAGLLYKENAKGERPIDLAVETDSIRKLFNTFDEEISKNRHQEISTVLDKSFYPPLLKIIVSYCDLSFFKSLSSQKATTPALEILPDPIEAVTPKHS